ncbi:hypothetical protein ASE14_05515 [Agromyces sp. Root81]|uniref:hypothetical protein n=1 Tax=Agromyces sp. Root81 TaxID=1736601 RepID=UPI0006FEBC37|nr:hypothetical protein [Agromyces sp. Root81]KRC60478.1 hypothetical protein ASE14_05515 [Agromyces sp. Root81]
MKSKLVWPLAVVAAVLAGVAISIAFFPTFFFADDTQAGAYGQWYKIGDRILAGDWSFVNPTVWQSGQYLAEGAWGLFSPVLWGIGLASHLVPSLLVFSTAVKVACLILGGLGAYLLAREFMASRPWSAVIAAAAPLAGFTLYMDAASWVNGLLAWSMWPLAWALTRRAVFRGKSIFPAVGVSLLLVGIGYVHGTLFLGLTIAATIVEALVARQRDQALRGIVIALFAGLFAIVVHLPSLLTAPVSARSTGLANTGLLTVDLSNLAASSSAIGAPDMGYFFSPGPNAPLLYIAWFVPLLAFVNWRTLLQRLKAESSLLIMLGLAAFAVLLPSDIGPLRFPVRLMPYLAMCVLLVVAIGLSTARLRPVTRTRFVTASVWYSLSIWFAFTQSPQFWRVMLYIWVAGVVVIWFAYRAYSARGLPFLKEPLFGRFTVRATPLVASVVMLLSVALLVPQHATHRQAPLRDYGVPTQVSDYRTQLDGAVGDVLVVGGPKVNEEADFPWSESVVSNLWYVTRVPVQNAYTSVFYAAYAEATCMDYNGITCPELYKDLFKPMPETGVPLVDLLGVSSVQVVKVGYPRSLFAEVPPDWHVVEDTPDTRLIVRDEPVAGAGGVVWTSPGTEVTVLHQDAMGVSFRVDEVGAEGGQVALSRIPWPGYRVDGAALAAEPVEGFLLGVDVADDAAGTVVTVSFFAPGWVVQAAAGLLIVLLAVGWMLLRRRGRRVLSNPDAPKSMVDRLAAATRRGDAPAPRP